VLVTRYGPLRKLVKNMQPAAGSLPTCRLGIGAPYIARFTASSSHPIFLSREQRLVRLPMKLLVPRVSSHWYIFADYSGKGVVRRIVRTALQMIGLLVYRLLSLTRRVKYLLRNCFEVWNIMS
jgi:hypothetical protein